MPAAIKDIFLSALDKLTPQERASYVEAACAGDDETRRQVEVLLAAHDQPDARLDRPAHLFPKSLEAALLPESSPRIGTMVGPYKLHEQIGEGGMGLVYMAEQQRPVRRLVALKVVKPGMDSKRVIARFEAERQALAMMDHPHIAKVLDAGTTESGHPYFVMELVRGVPINEFCDRKRLAVRQRLELFVQVCQAVQHAHQNGIIHRDLKPTNVLVTLYDEVAVPKVIDFGIAKALGQQLTDHTLVTGFVQMLGTPLYMSPEQADMNQLGVDTRSDVYSLGVMLYELLTGTAPIDTRTLEAASMDEIRRLIREVEPPTPSARLCTMGPQETTAISHRRGLDPIRLRHVLRGELDWIIMKALEKSRERRYPSAHDLAADVQRYLHDLPIVARPTPGWLRVQKWGRRHPVLTVFTVAAALFLGVLAGGAYWHNERLTTSLNVSERLRKEGEAREKVLRRELYANEIQRASSLLTAGRNAAARQILERLRLQAGETDTLGIEWSYLWNTTQPHEPVRAILGHAALLLTADVSPDQRLLVSSDREGVVKIWDLATGAEVRSLQYGSQEVTSARFSPDGRLLATAGQDKTVRIWNVADWTEAHKLEKHDGTITSVAWSPDCKRLASSGRDHFVHIWDCAKGVVETTLPEHTDVVRCLAWSPHGKWLATSDMNRGVLMWDTETRTLRGSLPIRDAADKLTGVLAIAFSADGQVVAYGGYGGIVRICDAERLLELASTAAMGHIWSLAFVDDEVLAVGTEVDCTIVHVSWHRRSANVMRKGLSDGSAMRAAIPLREGRQLITVSEQSNAIKLWEMSDLLGFEIERFEERPVALSPTEDTIATAPYEWPMTRWTPQIVKFRRAGSELPATFRYERRAECRPVFSGDGSYFAVPQPSAAEKVAIVSTKTWRITQELTPPGMRVAKLVYSHDGTWLAAAGPHCQVGAWNTNDGAWRNVLPPDETVAGESWPTALAFSRTEHLLAAARWNDDQITLWRPDRGIVRRLTPVHNVYALAFSPDGKLLAADTDDFVSLFDVATGHVLGQLLFANGAENVDVIDLAFSGDGATLAGAATDGTLRLWDMQSQRELLSVRLPGDPYLLQYLSSQRLAVACLQNPVIWFEPPHDR